MSKKFPKSTKTGGILYVDEEGKYSNICSYMIGTNNDRGKLERHVEPSLHLFPSHILSIVLEGVIK